MQNFFITQQGESLVFCVQRQSGYSKLIPALKRCRITTRITIRKVPIHIQFNLAGKCVKLQEIYRLLNYNTCMNNMNINEECDNEYFTSGKICTFSVNYFRNNNYLFSTLLFSLNISSNIINNYMLRIMQYSKYECASKINMHYLLFEILFSVILNNIL